MEKIIAFVVLSAVLLGACSNAALEQPLGQSAVSNTENSPAAFDTPYVSEEANIIAHAEIKYDDGGAIWISISEDDFGKNGAALAMGNGEDLKVEVSRLYAAIELFKQVEIDDYTIGITSGNESGVYICKDGNVLPESVAPPSFKGTGADLELVEVVLREIAAQLKDSMEI